MKHKNQHGEFEGRMYNFWTQTAIECYNIGCNCYKCELGKIMKNNCHMKMVVIELVKNIGIPKGGIRKDILED